MERLEELACFYVAFLRSVSLQHQNAHWLARGDNFYGTHLLFERLYKSSQEDVDLAAEKMVGLFGNECLDLKMQAEMIGKILKQFSAESSVEMSLAAEKKFLDISQKFYDKVKEADKMTLGLDDMIMAIASKREEACYLLQQTLKTAQEKSSKLAARKVLLKRFAKK